MATDEMNDPDEMTEAELADYYYRHRNDLAGDVVSSRKPEKLDVMISARFSRAEAAQVRAAAEQAGMSVSAFLRQQALTATGSGIVDLERVRADLTEVRVKVADALQVLTSRTARAGT